MKRTRRVGFGLAGASLVAVASIALLVLPGALGGVGTSGTTPHLTFAYRYVQDSDVCDNYVTASCTQCPWAGEVPLSTYSGSGLGLVAVCSDLLTASAAKIKWTADYHTFSWTSGGYKFTETAVNINETTGVLYSGQSMQFIFGINATGPVEGYANCYDGAIPDFVSISGVNTGTGKAIASVEIGLDGCG
jgi:hypothetical protein